MLAEGRRHGTDGEKYTPIGVLWQVVIHMVFIVSAVALAWIDRMSQQMLAKGHAHTAH